MLTSVSHKTPTSWYVAGLQSRIFHALVECVDLHRRRRYAILIGRGRGVVNAWKVWCCFLDRGTQVGGDGYFRIIEPLLRNVEDPWSSSDEAESLDDWYRRMSMEDNSVG